MDTLFTRRISAKKKIFLLVVISLLVASCALPVDLNFGKTSQAVKKATQTLSADLSSALADSSNPLITYGQQRVANPGFEITAPPHFASWMEESGGGGAVISDETAKVHSGQHAVELTYLSGVSQDLRVFPGEVYDLSFWMLGDGAKAGSIRILTLPDQADIVSPFSVDFLAATWQQINKQFTIPPACSQIRLEFMGSPSAGQSPVYYDDVSLKQVTYISTQKFIVFMGDSLTLGTSEGGEGSYPNQTRLLLDGPYDFVNLGTVSEQMWKMVSDAPEEVDPYFDARRQSNICVVWGGANDLTWTLPTDTYAQARAFWAGRRAAGFKVVVVTVIDAGSIDYATRLAFNNLVKSDPSLYDGLIDAGSTPELGAQNANLNSTYYQADHIHLTDAGNTIVARLAALAIAALK